MSDRLKKELSSTGIEAEPEEIDGKYIIDIEDQDEWGKYFSLLDDSDFHNDPDEDILELLKTKYTFYSKYYTYELSSDFEQDEYKLVITERK